jgi:uncharacterized protein (DUF2147 family)
MIRALNAPYKNQFIRLFLGKPTIRAVGLGLWVFLCAAFCLVPSSPRAAADRQGLVGPDKILGLWYTEDKEGLIELYRCPDSETDLCGKIIGPPDDAGTPPAYDTENPDPALRTRPQCGLQILGGFHPDSPTDFTDGWVYNPRDGNRYGASLRQTGPNDLAMRGYLLTPLLGSTQNWTRAPDDAPRCLIVPFAK